MKKIGIIAGTPVDTAMGEEYFKSRGLETVGFAAAADSRDALRFFGESDEYKEAQMKEAIAAIKAEGGEAVCVYCNALSAAVDFGKLSEAEDIKIVTPFDAYKVIGRNYSVIANISATPGTLVKFEESILAVNPDADVRGQHLQRLTDDIEKGEAPATLINKYGLPAYLKFCEEGGAQCLILTCTHFPYLKKHLQQLTSLPIIDPADGMYEECLIF